MTGVARVVAVSGVARVAGMDPTLGMGRGIGMGCVFGGSGVRLAPATRGSEFVPGISLCHTVFAVLATMVTVT
ncbi:hypothetical protein [Gordonia aurantiaca]|uniref:hypothetical protein n=1 Tax=Gordonia sp. B21 TaxID=3151852 RepID=UPI0032668D37